MTLASDSTEPTPIERVAKPTAELFRARYFEPGVPVVVTGGFEEWPALRRWTKAGLMSVQTIHPIPVDVYEDGNYFAIGGALGHRRRTHLATLAEYIERSASPARAKYYAPDLDLARFFPGLAGDVGRPSLLPTEARPRFFLFAGSEAITAGHFHPFTNAFTCQVIGRKRFVLYPPEARASLYPNPWFSPAFHWSRVDFLRPDYGRFPNLRAARPRECVLEPGEALFVPVHWWHWTRGFDFSASVLVSWKASVKTWHFPSPGLSCLFAMGAWPVENAARALGRRVLKSARSLSKR